MDTYEGLCGSGLGCRAIILRSSSISILQTEIVEKAKAPGTGAMKT